MIITTSDQLNTYISDIFYELILACEIHHESNVCQNTFAPYMIHMCIIFFFLTTVDTTENCCTYMCINSYTMDIFYTNGYIL